MRTSLSIKILSCLAGLFLLAGSLPAQSQFYVSPAGHDTSAGTLIMPWRTIQHALDHAVPGCTIYLMGGAYSENAEVTVSGTPGNPIVLKNYGSQNAVLSGAALSGGPLLRIHNAAYFTVTGLEFANYAHNNAQGILIDGTSEHITISRNRLHDIHFSANPGDVPNATTNAQPIVAYGDQVNTPLSNLIITGNRVYNCRTGCSEAIAVIGNVTGFVISGNEVHDITNTGIDVTGHAGICADPANDQPRSGEIRWNRTWSCISAYATSAGIYLDGARDCIVENNACYAGSYGIEIGCERPGFTASGIVVRSNLVYGNLVAGIAVGGYDYPNTGLVTGTTICNNTLYANAGGPAGEAELFVQSCSNISFRNNIVFAGAPGANAIVRLTNSCPGLAMDYNLYFTASSPLFDYNGNTCSSFTAWQSATGLESHSLYTDPLFVNAAASNFHLQAVSPAIDRGDSAYAAAPGETDMDTMMRVQNARIDLGADEYGTAVGIAAIAQENTMKLLLDRNAGTLEVQFAQPAAQATRIVLLMADGRLAAAADLPKGNSRVHFDIASLPPGSYIVYAENLRMSGVKFVR